MKKRWDFTPMFQAGQKLFERIRRKKRMASANHDVHLLARIINEWLPQGIQSLIEGTYTPRFLKRYYFKDEMLDQLYLADRVLQNLPLRAMDSRRLGRVVPGSLRAGCFAAGKI